MLHANEPAANSTRRMTRLGAPFLVALLLAGCGGAPKPHSADFVLRLGNASIAAPQDSHGRLRVRIERQTGFGAPIEIGLANPAASVGADTIVVEGEDEAWLPLHIGPGAVRGPIDVVVTGTAGDTTASVSLRIEVQAPQPRSPQLIRAALEAREIDLGTSLLYRAYAVFGDARLPARFLGSGPAEEDMSLFPDIEDAKATLPASSLAALQPFLARPDDPQSVFNGVKTNGGQNAGALTVARRTATLTADSEQCSGTRHEWITARSAAHPVRAWALCLGTRAGDQTAHNNLFRILDVVDKAYGKMVALMGPAKSDQYGDDAIDVYAVPPEADVPRQDGDYAIEGVRGVTISQPRYAGRTSSGYVMLPTYRLAQRDYQLTVIHELFHVLQFAHNYRLGDYWFTEASATWASFHFNRTAPVRPADNAGLHLERFGGFQQGEESSEGLLSIAKNHAYEAYVWPLFMEQEGGNWRIASAWSRFEDVSSHSAATAELDAVLNFKDNFRGFAVRNVNEALLPGDPVARRYKALDPAFPEVRPKYQDYVFQDGAETYSYPLDAGALAARYLRLNVAGDSRVQTIELDWSSVSGRNHLDVDALIGNGDKWISEPVKLESDPRPVFCFDLGSSTATRRGSFVELRLVLSNHAFDERVNGRVELRASKRGCNRWVGTSSSEILAGNTPIAKIHTQVSWIPDSDLNLSNAEVTYYGEGTTAFTPYDHCVTITPSTVAFTKGSNGFAQLIVDGRTNPPTYRGMGATIWSATYRNTCTGGSGTAAAGGAWFVGRGNVSSDGKTIEDTFADPGSGQTFIYSFSRKPVQVGASEAAGNPPAE